MSHLCMLLSLCSSSESNVQTTQCSPHTWRTWASHCIWVEATRATHYPSLSSSVWLMRGSASMLGDDTRPGRILACSLQCWRDRWLGVLCSTALISRQYKAHRECCLFLALLPEEPTYSACSLSLTVPFWDRSSWCLRTVWCHAEFLGSGGWNLFLSDL